MKDITIYVTQEHINSGCKLDHSNCMVAKALYDSGFKQSIVTPFFINIYNDSKEEKLFFHINSNYLGEKIMKFDNGEEIESFSFVMKGVPEEFLVKK